ncbi:hypothetical protein HZS_2922 [Henneguya salminicola]|nr:hypothetical protein HZS_2922 [Henneguya salminicola]
MVRQRINLLLNLSSDAARLIIPEQYKMIYDISINDGDRFNIFATPSHVNILSLSSDIYFDSTFKSFHIILYKFFGFALMQRKTGIPYKKDWVKALENVEITCETTLWDFEKASIKIFIL